ncbi:hypothetical protein C8Q74DRAFT_1436761 [Fomes fomentarius]|nr:hypothetical protein C8Q74DRAFT_1436761 [Fomes fomentarius]
MHLSTQGFSRVPSLWTGVSRLGHGCRRIHKSHTPIYDHPSTKPAIYDQDKFQKKPVHIRTLYRDWLHADDFVDLSDGRGVVIDPRTGRLNDPEALSSANAAYITYGRRERMEGRNRVLSHQPFPVNTRGFFYFHRHPRIPMASSLRFRLLQTPDPRAFAKGNDLLTEFGTPWQISLLAIAKSPRYSILREILLRDRFVTNNLLTRCEEMVAPRMHYSVGPWNQLVFETLEPFYLDLSKPTNGIVLVGMENIYPTPLNSMFPRINYPFKSGRLICRFEPSRGAHAHKHMVMRVLRIVEPVQMVDSYDHEGGTGMPVVNHLITHQGKPSSFLTRRRGLGEAKYALWTRHNEKWEWTWNWNKYRKTTPRSFHFPWDEEAEDPWRRRLAAFERAVQFSSAVQSFLSTGVIKRDAQPAGHSGSD